MKILVAIPAYDGKLCAETVDSLLGESLLAFSQGHVLDVRVLSGCSAIHSARNALTYDFEHSECDRLFFLDSDISWTPGDLLKVALSPHDLIGVGYRHKRQNESYIVHWADEPELWADEHGAIKVKGLGTGFLAVSRDCLKRIREHYGPRFYGDGEREIYAYFDMPYDGVLWGEDLRFCHMASEAGSPCHVLPEIELTHVGGPGNHFKGRLGDWLRARMQGSEHA